MYADGSRRQEPFARLALLTCGHKFQLDNYMSTIIIKHLRHRKPEVVKDHSTHKRSAGSHAEGKHLRGLISRHFPLRQAAPSYFVRTAFTCCVPITTARYC